MFGGKRRLVTMSSAQRRRLYQKLPKRDGEVWTETPVLTKRTRCGYLRTLAFGIPRDHPVHCINGVGNFPHFWKGFATGVMVMAGWWAVAALHEQVRRHALEIELENFRKEQLNLKEDD